MVVRKYSYAVLGLEHKWKTWVVYKDTVLQSTVYWSKVFCIEAFFESAVLAIESMREILLLWVKVVEDDICVGGTAGGKDDNFSDGC